MKKILPLLFFFGTLSGYAQGTASPNVSTFEIEAPQLDTIKKIWIYLPRDYKTSEKRYPVLYMHDAQNLFDTETSFAGEWKVDEMLDSLEAPGVIVVGLEHGNSRRLDELTPFSHEKYGGGKADAYLAFLRNTLKPHIDATYRTMPNPEKTTIMGSSLGGLVSFYAILKYPDTFGQAGIFSPSFWFSDKIFGMAEGAKISDHHRFYFLGGTAEGEEMVHDLHKMKEILRARGIPGENIEMKLIEGGQHNEAFWSAHFLEAFDWLFSKETSEVILKIHPVR